MTIGPLELIVLGFNGERFDGAFAREMGAVIDSGVIRIVDLVFVSKDAEGNAVVRELQEIEDDEFEPFAELVDHVSGLLTAEDVAEVVGAVPAGSAATIVLFEHAWAEGLKEALHAAGGFMVADHRVPPEVLAQLNEELEGSRR
jgi:hypothetical protein